MKNLSDIRDYVQNIAETIESVVGVDVTIVDHRNIRIAATGKYRDKIGQRVVDKSVFMKSIKEFKSYIVNEPRSEEVCLDCENRGACIEYAEVCSPIVKEGKAIGVIGLVALSMDQKMALRKNEENLLEFLKRMGDLLSTKLYELENIEKERILLKQIEMLINSIEEGIIAFDEKMNIMYVNKKVIDMFNSHENEKSSMVEEFLGRIDLKGVLLREVEINNLNISFRNTEVLINVKPIELDSKIIGGIISIRTINEINKMINEVSGSGITTGFDEIIGISDKMIEVKERAKKAAIGASTVLILGESGTGKEVFARAIHSYSKRSEKPFIAINCAAIPESLLESELFGYEEGAFTGAKKGGKIGKFELANGGTIFLDEIGDMPLHLQTKLLRVIQERTIERVGSSRSINIDVRIIAATHKDLNQMVKNGEFRIDLFYRLNVIPLSIPPLRERKEDIEILIRYILDKFNYKIGKNINDISGGVLNVLKSYSWPGNVRELENVLEYAVNMESSETIEMDSLPIRLKEDNSLGNVFNLKEVEKTVIEKVLEKYKNRDQAAKILGIGRATLFRKIKEYKIEVSE